MADAATGDGKVGWLIDWRAPVILVAGSAACWLIVFATVAPAQQEFPLLDDWAYARGLFQFAQGKGLHYFNWAAVPQLGQWLWALPFVYLLGAGHVVLRVSTILLGLAGLVAFYDLLRLQGCSSARAGFIAAALAFNPLFFILQGTFMTDVPALTFALISLALYSRALALGRLWLMAAAAVVAVLAVTTRQNALAAPLVAAYLLSRPTCPFRRDPRWWLLVLLPVAVGVATHFWFEARPDVRTVEPTTVQPLLLVLLPWWALHFCGLAVLPVAVCVPPRALGKQYVIALSAMLAGALYWYHLPLMPHEGLFPYWQDMVLGCSGVGKPELYAGRPPLLLDETGQWVVTVAGCLGGAALLVRLAQEWREAINPLLAFTGLQAILLAMTPTVYDRHFLFLIPGALAVVGAPRGIVRERWLPGMICLFATAVLSVCLVHDWFSWNSTLSALGRRAVESHRISPADIEGGFEWDGWHSSQAERLSYSEFGSGGKQVKKPPVPPGLVRTWNHPLFPTLTGRYALAFSYLPGTVARDSIPYRLWLSPGKHAMLLLQDERPSGPAP